MIYTCIIYYDYIFLYFNYWIAMKIHFICIYLYLNNWISLKTFNNYTYIHI